jgi:hypothetical protein
MSSRDNSANYSIKLRLKINTFVKQTENENHGTHF